MAWLCCGLVALGMLVLTGRLLLPERPEGPGAAEPVQQEAAVSNEVKILKLASPFSRDSFASRILNDFCSRVNANGAQTLYIQLYENGALGSESETLEAIRNGRLELCAVNSGNLTALIPEAEPLFVPFRASTREEAVALLDSEEAQRVYEKMEAQGVQNLGYFWNGFRYVWSSTPVRSLADLGELRLRLPGVPVFQAAFDGVVAAQEIMPMDDVHTALLVGTVDAFEQDLTEVVRRDVCGLTPYCLKLNHAFSATTLLMNQEVWQTLTARERVTLMDCMEQSIRYADDLCEKQEQTWQQYLETHGTTFTALPAEEQALVREQMSRQAWDYVNAALGGE